MKWISTDLQVLKYDSYMWSSEEKLTQDPQLGLWHLTQDLFDYGFGNSTDGSAYVWNDTQHRERHETSH